MASYPKVIETYSAAAIGSVVYGSVYNFFMEDQAASNPDYNNAIVSVSWSATNG